MPARAGPSLPGQRHANESPVEAEVLENGGNAGACS